MSEIHLDELISGKEERDAIHVAVCPVIANAKLSPGEHVGLIGRTKPGPTAAQAEYIVGKSTKPIGVISPFLRQPVLKGDRCWLMLYPNTITSLRHEWAHPVFEEFALQDAADASNLLANVAEEMGLSFHDFLAALHCYVDHGKTTRASEGSYDLPVETWQQVWRAFEALTGKRTPSDEDYHPFYCSC